MGRKHKTGESPQFFRPAKCAAPPNQPAPVISNSTPAGNDALDEFGTAHLCFLAIEFLLVSSERPAGKNRITQDKALRCCTINASTLKRDSEESNKSEAEINGDNCKAVSFVVLTLSH